MEFKTRIGEVEAFCKKLEEGARDALLCWDKIARDCVNGLKIAI